MPFVDGPLRAFCMDPVDVPAGQRLEAVLHVRFRRRRNVRADLHKNRS